MKEVAATLPDHLMTLERSLLDPELRTEPVQVENLLADDFVEFGSSGRIWTREATVRQLAGEPRRRTSAHHLEDFAVRGLADDTALATYTLLSRSGQGVEARSLRSSIWTRIEGQWRMAFHQGTSVPSGE